MPPRRHVTPRMLAANRANARLSTGPRTSAGKARSRANALAHGLRAGVLAAPLFETDDDRAALADLVAALRACYAPAGPGEERLVVTLAESCFAMRHAFQVQTDALAAKAAAYRPGDEWPCLSTATIKACTRYEATWMRRFWQSLDLLDEIQARRRGIPRLPRASAFPWSLPRPHSERRRPAAVPCPSPSRCRPLPSLPRPCVPLFTAPSPNPPIGGTVGGRAHTKTAERSQSSPIFTQRAAVPYQMQALPSPSRNGCANNHVFAELTHSKPAGSRTDN